MRLIDLLHFGEKELKTAGVEEYQIDARILLEYCTGKSRTGIFLDGATSVNKEVQVSYQQLLESRKKRRPLAYIIGEQEFWSLPFFVSPDVLIPRPETEFLLDRVLALTDPVNFQQDHILDLCCGSGVIAIVLAKETGKTVIASDISGKALLMTRKNSRRHHVDSQVVPVQGSLLAPFGGREKLSLIVTNPPYVSSFALSNSLLPEVVDYEPHLALDGGEKGLTQIEVIRNQLPEVLCPGGQCFIEIGADQGAAARKLFLENDSGRPEFQQVDILVDYTGRDRVVHARLAQ
jgi:release factor glutamine methyltransferase